MNTFSSLDAGPTGSPRLDVLPQAEFQTLNKQWDQNNALMQSTMGQIGMLGQLPATEAADPLRVGAFTRLFNALAPEQRQIAERTALNRFTAIRPQLQTLLRTATTNMGSSHLRDDVRAALQRDIIDPLLEQPSGDPTNPNPLATFFLRTPNGLTFNGDKAREARRQILSLSAGAAGHAPTLAVLRALEQAIDICEHAVLNISQGTPTPSDLAAQQNQPQYVNGVRIPTTGEQTTHVVRLMGTLVGSAGLLWSGFTWLLSGQGGGVAGFYAASLAAIAYGPRLLQGEVEHYVRDVQDLGRSPLFQTLLSRYTMNQHGEAWAAVARRLMDANQPDALAIIATAQNRVGPPTQEQEKELKLAQESLLKALQPHADIRERLQQMITQNGGRDMTAFAGIMRQLGSDEQARNVILGYITSGANQGMLAQLGDFARNVPRA